MKKFELYIREDDESCAKMIKLVKDKKLDVEIFDVATPTGHLKAIDNNIMKLPLLLVYECVDRLYTLEEVKDVASNDSDE